MTDPLFQKACIVGIGLIGSSLAHGMREHHLCTEIVGCDLSQDVCDKAVSLGVVTEAGPSPSKMVSDCDLIILSVPVGAMSAVLLELNVHAAAGAIIMDVGSVKGSVAEAADGLRDDLYFVPAHPVAGTEKSGPSAGFASLFEKRWSIITPLENPSTEYKAALTLVEALWQGLGADTVQMDAQHHDIALAVTSHLPHLIAFTLVSAADDIESVNEKEVVKYSAGGFRDFTRIAASDPVMWRDVFLHNREAVLEVLGHFSEELAAMQKAIRWGDGEALEKAFSRARGLRREIIEAGQEVDLPNFGRDQEKTIEEE